MQKMATFEIIFQSLYSTKISSIFYKMFSSTSRVVCNNSLLVPNDIWKKKARQSFRPNEPYDPF